MNKILCYLTSGRIHGERIDYHFFAEGFDVAVCIVCGRRWFEEDKIYFKRKERQNQVDLKPTNGGKQ